MAVLVVGPNLAHTGKISDRPVAGHDHLRRPRVNDIQSRQQVRNRPRPQDRMALHKQDVAGVHH